MARFKRWFSNFIQGRVSSALWNRSQILKYRSPYKGGAMKPTVQLQTTVTVHLVMVLLLPTLQVLVQHFNASLSLLLQSIHSFSLHHTHLMNPTSRVPLISLRADQLNFHKYFKRPIRTWSIIGSLTATDSNTLIEKTHIIKAHTIKTQH